MEFFFYDFIIRVKTLGRKICKSGYNNGFFNWLLMEYCCLHLHLTYYCAYAWNYLCSDIGKCVTKLHLKDGCIAFQCRL